MGKPISHPKAKRNRLPRKLNCGPPGFMQSIYDDLRSLGVSDARIFAEAFGPASLARKPDNNRATNEEASVSIEAEQSTIRFSASGIEQRWKSGDTTILEVAEANDLNPEFSCRNGICGSCATKLLSGEVAYRHEPTATHEPDEVLICCAVPAAGYNHIELDL